MLLVEPPMPDRSRMMTQTKRDTLVLQVGRFGVGLTNPHSKKLIVTKVEQRKKLDGFNDDGVGETGKKWKDLVRQGKAHSGLQCQWKKKKNSDLVYYSIYQI
jgi:hypothetical protein